MRFTSDDAIDVKLSFFRGWFDTCHFYIHNLEMIPLHGTSLKEAIDLVLVDNFELLNLSTPDFDLIDNSGQIINGVLIAFTSDYSWKFRVAYFDSSYVDIDFHHSIGKGETNQLCMIYAKRIPA